MTDFLTKTLSLSVVTYRDIIRDKVLYSGLLIAFLLLGTGYLASGLTFVQPFRIILNFGMTTVIISSVFVGIFLAAGMIGREIDTRTIHVALSRPVSRTTFIIGKYLGFAKVLTVNWLLISGSYLFILVLSGGGIYETLLIGLYFALLQGLLAGAIAVFFSSFSTTTLSVILTIGFYLVGTNISQLKYLAAIAPNQLMETAFTLLAQIFPNFENHTLSLEVTYRLPVSDQFFWFVSVYTLIMIVFFLVLAGYFFRKREI